MNRTDTILLAGCFTAVALLCGCGAPVDAPEGVVAADDDDGPGAVGGSTGEGGDGPTAGSGGAGAAGSGGSSGTAGAGVGGSEDPVEVKHNPGHYISMRPTDGDAEIVDSLRPGVSG
ncbi:MAG: hypothetical protein JRI23_23595, partial [Deltaproteobacteria bacterium]|nr:hypothetical protein [Deltaproteobacteria bacterium]MBW2534975.1 hypothetical protein [Deltaproteobacteria bacterium]